MDHDQSTSQMMDDDDDNNSNNQRMEDDLYSSTKNQSITASDSDQESDRDEDGCGNDDDDDNNDEYDDNSVDEDDENDANTVTESPLFHVDDRVYYVSDETSSKTTTTKKKLEVFEAIIRQTRLDTITMQSSSKITTVLKWKYLIHFVGWHSRHDRWVDSDSLRQEKPELPSPESDIATDGQIVSTEETSRKQNNAQQKKRMNVSVENNSNTNTDKNEATTNKRIKKNSPKGNASPTSTTGTIHSNSFSEYIYSDYCEIPFTLRTVLIEEYEYIVGVWRSNGCSSTTISNGHNTSDSNNGIDDLKSNQPTRLVHVLPSPIPIRKMINHFVKKKSKEYYKYHTSGSTNANNITENNTKNRQKNDQSLSVGSIPSFDSTTDKNTGKTNGSIEKGSTISTSATNKLQKTSNKNLIPPNQIEKFAKGLIELFEQALPKFLLYPQERPQYEYIQKKLQKRIAKENANSDTNNNNNNATKSTTSTEKLVDIYGCDYLLRLFVRLPIILQPSGEISLVLASSSTSTASTDPSKNGTSASETKTTATTLPQSKRPLHDVQILGSLLHELLVVMQKNRQSLFCTKNTIGTHYRTPIRGKEWLDWEEQVYGSTHST